MSFEKVHKEASFYLNGASKLLAKAEAAKNNTGSFVLVKECSDVLENALSRLTRWAEENNHLDQVEYLSSQRPTAGQVARMSDSDLNSLNIRLYRIASRSLQDLTKMNTKVSVKASSVSKEMPLDLAHVGSKGVDFGDKVNFSGELENKPSKLIITGSDLVDHLALEEERKTSRSEELLRTSAFGNSREGKSKKQKLMEMIESAQAELDESSKELEAVLRKKGLREFALNSAIKELHDLLRDEER